MQRREQVLSNTCHYMEAFGAKSMGGGTQTYFFIDVPSSEYFYVSKNIPAYFTPNLLGGSVTFEIDTNQMGCGCIGQVSLVAKPVMETDCYFGCDARGHSGTGTKCPEFTLFEGNKYGFKTTPHTCSEPTARGLFQQCDSEGDLVIDSYEFESGYSYGPGKDIDTQDSLFLMINFNAEED